MNAINGLTKKNYQGINALNLALVSDKRHYNSNVWLTFNQIKKMDGKLKKGSKGTPIYYFEQKKIKVKEEIENKNGDKEIEEKMEIKFLLRKYNVFNGDDIEGIEFNIPELKTLPIKDSFQSIIDNASKYIPIQHSDPAYSPTKHILYMPKIEEFNNVDSYMAALFHELSHSTIKFVKDYSKRKNFSYAEEELVAEISATFLCSYTGVDYPMDRHASYIKSWGTEVEEKSFYKILTEAFNASQIIIDKLELEKIIHLTIEDKQQTNQQKKTKIEPTI